MRVLFTTWSTASHYLPMVPLGWALRAAGHEVRVACQPSFAPFVERTGLHPAITGFDIDVSGYWKDAEVEGQDRSSRAITMFSGVGEQLADPTTAFAREWGCDLVVYEPRAYAGLITAARLGVPAVRHLYGVDYTYERHPTEHPLLAPLWNRLGLEINAHGALTIDPCPPSLQVQTPPNSLVIRHIPYNGPELVPTWLSTPPSRPRVCVTWGTTFAKTAGHLTPLQTVLEGLHDLDIEIVVAIAKGQRPLLNEIPPGTRVVESMPLSLLLPTCSLVIHQGGPGTALAAVAAGVPQVTVPSIGDQPLNTRQLTTYGAARGVDFTSLTAPAIHEAARTTLKDPTYSTRAKDLQQESRSQQPPAKAIPHLEALTP